MIHNRTINKIQIPSKKFEKIPEWTKCKECNHFELKKDFEENLNICAKCDYHHYINTTQRFKSVFDKYEIMDQIQTIDDPLKFIDTKSYLVRLEEQRKKTKLHEAIQFAEGEIDKLKVIVGVMDFSFIGGSLSFFVGESIVNAAQIALEKKLPLVIFTASGGARMQEGIISLMQMPRTILALKKLKINKLPYINVITHPTTGGVSASFAMMGDITLAEPKATIGLAGVRVIEQTLREKIPNNFQTSEFQFDHGFIDMIVHRKDIKNKLAQIIKIFDINQKKQN